MKRFTMLVAAAGLALAACATGAASTLDARPNGSTAVVDSPTPRGDRATPAKAKDTGSRRQAESCGKITGGSEDHFAQLVDVRVGAHEGYDRVTFEFAPSSDGQHFGLPQYEIVAVTPPIRQDGSGDTVEVDGESFAAIVFRGASGWGSMGPTYDGPKEFRPGYQALTEAEQTGDFEAILSWTFGLKQGSCWTVVELDDPLRVAIDFSY